MPDRGELAGGIDDREIIWQQLDVTDPDFALGHDHLRLRRAAIGRDDKPRPYVAHGDVTGMDGEGVCRVVPNHEVRFAIEIDVACPVAVVVGNANSRGGAQDDVCPIVELKVGPLASARREVPDRYGRRALVLSTATAPRSGQSRRWQPARARWRPRPGSRAHVVRAYGRPASRRMSDRIRWRSRTRGSARAHMACTSNVGATRPVPDPEFAERLDDDGGARDRPGSTA